MSNTPMSNTPMSHPSSVKVLAFAGSLRKDSWNKKLVKASLAAAAAAGAQTTFADFRDLPMPLYDEDLEKSDGLPPNARRFKDLLLGHHAILIASPEYNSSISAVLKNAIDWASRPATGPDGKPEAPLACFNGKVAGLLAASPGALGGLRGLVELRRILGNINVIVLPQQVAVMKAHEAFDDAGNLKDEKQQAQVSKLAHEVIRVAGKLI
jgi:chromate reductase, NAD(P)H dehydrogenase (quinone)